MAVDTTYINNVTKYIEKATPLAADEANRDYFEKAVTYVANAEKAMADNEEKHAMLEDAVTRWANQLTFMLFREGSLTAELEKEYRSFKPVTETTKAVDEFKNARQAEIDKINEEHEKVITAQKGIDIFQAIIGGMSAEEAKVKLEEYEKQLAQAQAQLQR